MIDGKLERKNRTNAMKQTLFLSSMCDSSSKESWERTLCENKWISIRTTHHQNSSILFSSPFLNHINTMLMMMPHAIIHRVFRCADKCLVFGGKMYDREREREREAYKSMVLHRGKCENEINFISCISTV